MSNPFTLIRKYQKFMLVSAALLAMGIFGLAPALDYLGKRGPAGGQGSNQVKTQVKWRGGSLSNVEIDNFRMRHFQTLSFLGELAERGVAANGEPKAPGLIRVASEQQSKLQSDKDTVELMMLAEKAKQEGFEVGDLAVDQYMELVSDRKVPAEQYNSILKKVIGDSVSLLQIREHLKKELAARNFYSVIGSGIGGPNAAAPVEAWEAYERLNRTATCEVLEIDVLTKVDEVTGEPTSNEVKALYKEGKLEFPDPRHEKPGFKVPDQAKLAYFMIDRQAIVQRERQKISDETVQKTYEEWVAKKDPRVLDLTLADDEDDQPALTPAKKDGDESKNDQSSEDQKKQEADNQKKNGSDGEASKSDADKADKSDEKGESGKSDTESKSDSLKGKTEESKSESEPKNSDAKSDSSDSLKQDGEDQKQDASSCDPAFQDEKTTEADTAAEPQSDNAKTNGVQGDEKKSTSDSAENKSDDSKSDDSKSDETKSDEEKSEPKQTPDDVKNGSDTDEKTGDEKTGDDTKGDETKGDDGEQPSTIPPKGVIQEPKIKPLDSKLAEEIRNSLVPFESIRDQLEKAIEKCNEAIDDYQIELESSKIDAEAGDEVSEPPMPDFAAIAKKYFATYGETDELMTIEDFEEHPFGREFIFIENQPLSIAQYAFYFYERTEVFKRMNAQGAKYFVFWFTEKEDAHVPEMDECRQKIVEYWKYQKGLEAAKEEANGIASKVEADKQTLTAAYPDKAKSAGQFTWMSSNMFNRQAPPGISRIFGVENAGGEFMKTVFSMSVGDVKIAPNATNEKIYVIQLTDIDQDEVVMQESYFRTPPFGSQSLQVSNSQVNQIIDDYIDGLMKEMEVKWLE